MEFSFNDMQPWNPLAGALAEGPHKVKITAIDPNYNGGKSSKITVEIMEGPSPAGMTTDLFPGNADEAGKNSNARKWLLILASILPPEKVEAFLTAARAGQIRFDPARDSAKLLGKTSYMLVTAAPGTNVDPATGRERPNLPDKEFLTAAQYAALTSGAAKAPVKAAPAATAQNGAAGHTPAATQAAPATQATPAAQSAIDALFG